LFYVAEDGYRLIDTGFRKLFWILWISIFRLTRIFLCFRWQYFRR